MAISKNTQAIDRITPKQSGGLRIVFSKPGGDETALALSSKGDNDYITKKEYTDNTALPIAPIITAVIGGVTHYPLTVNYGASGMSYPSVIYRNPDGSRYTGATDTDDGANIIVTGSSADGITFADTFNFIIKP